MLEQKLEWYDVQQIKYFIDYLQSHKDLKSLYPLEYKQTLRRLKTRLKNGRHNI